MKLWKSGREIDANLRGTVQVDGGRYEKPTTTFFMVRILFHEMRDSETNIQNSNPSSEWCSNKL